MFTGTAIEQIVENMKKRKAHLFHACQYRDFKSYLALGGIPSRSTLEKKGLAYTAFSSDTSDRARGVWDKVFLNMDDFGEVFHRFKGNASPNAYGPIIFKLEPDLLVDAKDVSLTLRSAGKDGYDRNKDSLSTLEQFEGLYRRKKDEKFAFDLCFINNLDVTLYAGLPLEGSPELSLTMDIFGFGSGKASFDYVSSIVVDPLIASGKDLFSEVVKDCETIYPGLGSFVKKRYSARPVEYSEIAKLVEEGITSLEEVEQISESESTRLWARSCIEAEYWNYPRFSKYLLEGTINELSPIRHTKAT